MWTDEVGLQEKKRQRRLQWFGHVRREKREKGGGSKDQWEDRREHGG